MSALTFTLKSAAFNKHHGLRIDCRALTPDRLHQLSISQIEQLPLSTTTHTANGQALTVADLFEVTGQGSQHVVFKSSNDRLDYIGHQMQSGQITVDNDCGDFCASQMQGGVFICKGNAGARLGDKMRRGIVLIDGNVGDYCASRMVAGTIGIAGTTAAHLGYGLRRGTLLLTQLPLLDATWQNCGQLDLPFLSLLFNAFKPLDSRFAIFKKTRAQRWVGDASQNGKGEILLLQG